MLQCFFIVKHSAMSACTSLPEKCRDNLSDFAPRNTINKEGLYEIGHSALGADQILSGVCTSYNTRIYALSL
jgi:hypothetical protein